MKKVEAYFGIEDKDLIFYPNGRRECRVHLSGCYVRLLNDKDSTSLQEEAEILAKELEVDSFVIPKHFDGQVILHVQHGPIYAV